jgi:hypothetical protein
MSAKEFFNTLGFSRKRKSKILHRSGSNGQNYRIAPTLSDPDSLHVVVMDGYAVG